MSIQGISGSSPSTGFLGLPVGTVIDFNTALTADDKNVFKAATGYDVGTQQGPNGNPLVPHLAVAIANGRATGELQGPITASFLSKYASDATIGSSIIQKALAYLATDNTATASRPGYAVSYTA